MNDMADYFDGSESAKAKIVSAVWDVHEVNGELFGVIRTGLREILSPAEEQEWIDELIGQAATTSWRTKLSFVNGCLPIPTLKQ